MLLSLFAIFMGPILVAWTLLLGPKDFHPEATSNRGVLIEPVKHISVTDIRSSSIGDGYFQGLWTLLYLQPGNCSQSCQEALYKIRQSWKALDRDRVRVQRAYFSTQSMDVDTLAFLKKEHPGLDIGQITPTWLEKWSSLKSYRLGIIVIVDPRGHALMYYQFDDDPRGLIKDMKQLLKLSKIG